MADANPPAGDAGAFDAGDGADALGCPGINDPSLPGIANPTTYVGIRPVYSGPGLIIATDAIITWTATDGPGETGAGTFANPCAAFTQFTCSQDGDVTLTVHLGRAGTACDATQTFLVRCKL
jgi:hypothetical protein